jgi:hypothetical protein
VLSSWDIRTFRVHFSFLQHVPHTPHEPEIRIRDIYVTQKLNTGDSHYKRGLHPCKLLQLLKTCKMRKSTNHHFYVKLAPEFCDAKLIICITFLDKPQEGSMLVNRLYNLAIECWSSSQYWNKTVDMRKYILKACVMRVICTPLDMILRQVNPVPIFTN